MSNQINSIIIDDEKFAITALESDLKAYCKNVKVLDRCESSKDGLLSIKTHRPDLVFLDINMPWMNGIEMLDILGNSIKFGVIFTTAHTHYAAKAFRLSAIDYLLKPIDKNELIQAVEKALASANSIGSKHRINNLLHNHRQPAEKQKLALPNREGYEFINVDDIAYCKADGAYTNIILTSTQNILLSKSLGELAEMLPGELFERIHHSTIVNINSIRQFVRRENAFLIMKDGQELSISKSKKETLLQRLGLNK